MEDLILKLADNTSLFELTIIIVLGLVFYFKLKDHTTAEVTKLDVKIDKVESGLNGKIDKVESGLNDRLDKVETGLNDRLDKVEDRIDKINMRLDNLYHELFKKKAA